MASNTINTLRIMAFIIITINNDVLHIAGNTLPSENSGTHQETLDGPDSLGDMVLTPWWPLTFSVGETLEVDCGVFTGGDVTNLTIYWKHPNGKMISEDKTSRMRAYRTDKNYPSDKENGAFSIVTMTLEATFDDRGDFTCYMERQTATELITNNKTIHVDVVSNEQQCGFESKDLCGWGMDNTSDILWYWHNGEDVESMSRMKALRYDHTYGSSKHIGHFLDVDIKRDNISTSSIARLISPEYAGHTTQRCMDFWYIVNGNDHEHLKVLVQPISEEPMNATEMFVIDANMNSAGEWELGRFAIPPQNFHYKIIIEAIPCKNSQCKLGAIAIDDVHMHDNQCDEVKYMWPDNRLQVRLVNGTRRSNGRVEILHDGRWGTICSDQFGNADAIVICKMLGFNDFGAIGKRISPFGSAPSNYIIWLHKVACLGKEKEIGSCQSKDRTWGDNDCSHDSDAAVYCQETFITTKAAATSMPEDLTMTPPVKQDKSIATPTTPPTTPRTVTTTKVKISSTPNITEKQNSTLITTLITSMKPQPAPVVTLIITDKQDQKKTTPTMTSSTITEESDNNTDNISESYRSFLEEHRGLGTGAVVTICFLVLFIVTAIAIFTYRKRKFVSKKSNYIVFSNPKYNREHLPSNDISLDSPLTSSLSILA